MTDETKPPEETMTPEELETYLSRVEDFFGKTLVDRLQKAVDSLLSEEKHFHARLLMALLRGGLESLKHYIEDPEEKEVSWENPWTELRYPVEWDWEEGDLVRLRPEDYSEETLAPITDALKKGEDPFKVAPDAVQRLGLAMLVHAHGEQQVLFGLTHEVAVHVQDGAQAAYFFLDPKLKRDMEALSTDEERDAFMRAQLERVEEEGLLEPFSIGGLKVVDENGETRILAPLDHEEAEPGTLPPAIDAIEEKLRTIPKLHFGGEVNGVSFQGSVVFMVHPLVVDEDKREAYFPIVTGLVFAPGNKGGLMVYSPGEEEGKEGEEEPPREEWEEALESAMAAVSPANWPEADRADLWKSLLEDLPKKLMEDLGVPEEKAAETGEPATEPPTSALVLSSTPASAGAPPPERLSPFYGLVPRTSRMDTKTKSYIEAASGAPRSRLFKKLKSVTKEARSRSRQFLEDYGEARWKEAGGTRHQKTGEPTWKETSPKYGELLHQLALADGAYLREFPEDAQAGRPPRREFCFLEELPGGGGLLEYAWTYEGDAAHLFPDWLEEKRKELEESLPLDPEEVETGKKLLTTLARGGQLLWLLHVAAWEQRTKLVVVPDVTLAQALWTGDEKRWPRNPHEEIERVLESLGRLEIRNRLIEEDYTSSLRGPVWKAVSGYNPPHWRKKDGVENAPQECPGLCPLYGLKVPHGHYIIGLAPTFMGALNAWKKVDGAKKRTIPRASSSDPEEVLYSWGKKMDRKAIGSGYTKGVDPLPGVFLTAAWAGLTHTQRALLTEVLNRLTATKAGPVHYTSETAFRTHRRSLGPSPHLAQGVQYVCFGGHGGFGYTIGGTSSSGTPGVRGGRRGGWLEAVGAYRVNPGPRGSVPAIRAFLKDLRRVVVEILGGVVSCHLDGKWYTLTDAEVLTNGKTWTSAARTTLFPLAPSDYKDRLRDYAKEKGRFSAIPEDQEELDAAVAEAAVLTPEELRAALGPRGGGIKHRDFAKALGVSPAWLSRFLAGDRGMKPELLLKAKTLLEGWKTSPEG